MSYVFKLVIRSLRNKTFGLKLAFLILISQFLFLNSVLSQCTVDSLNFTWKLTNNCQPVNFNPIVSFGKGPYTFSWNFGDNTNSSDNTSGLPSHIYYDSTSAPVSYTVTLKVTDSKNKVCSITKTIIIQPTPVIMMDSTDVLNYPTPFVHCIPQGQPCNLVLKDKSKFKNSHFHIDWGDGTFFDNPAFPPTLKHTYPAYNQYNVIATSPAGCISYTFFCGSNPAGGIGCPANTLSCEGLKLNFPVDAQTLQNPLGTSYLISFMDGSKDLTYDQASLPPVITHVYKGNTACIALEVKMKATNACGFKTSSCFPVLISTKPNPDFGFIRKVATADCANLTQYIFKNATSPCCIKPDGTKDVGVKLKWTFSPSSYKILKGSLDSSEVTVVFLNKTCYTVDMNVINANANCSKCGDTNITKVICMDSLPIAKAVPSAFNNFSNCSIPFKVNITNLSSGAKSYLWTVTPKTTNPFWSVSFVNGTNKNSVNPVLQFNQPDTFRIVLSAFNQCGFSTDTIDIIIVSPPTVKLNKPMIFCGPDSFSIKIDTNNVQLSNVHFQTKYIWSISPSTGVGNTTSFSQFPEFTFNSSHLKSYKLYVSVDNLNGCPPVTDSTVINFSDKPLLAVSTDKQNICVGDTVLLSVKDNSINNGLNIIYRWYQPDSTGGLADTTGSKLYAAPKKTTTYNVKGYMASNPVCQDIATITINVNPLPIIKVIPVDTTICTGSSLEIRAFGGSSYQWAPVNSTSSSITVSPLVNTTYTVTGTGLNGCRNTATSTVRVQPLPVINFTNKAIEFVNTDVSFNNLSANADTFLWNFGDASTSSEQFPFHKYKFAGTYDVSLTGTGSNSCPGEYHNKIKIISNFPFSLKGDSGCSPVNVNFINNSVDPELRYFWDFGFNNLTSTSPNPGTVTFTSNTDAVFTVTLYLIYNSDTISAKVKVHVFNKPVANFTLNPRCGCPVLDVNITNFSQSALPYSSLWKFGNGNSVYEPIFSPHFSYKQKYKGIPADTTYYTVTLIDSNRCGTSSVSNIVTVFPDNIIVDFSADKTNICINEGVRFTNLSKFYTSFFWDFGDSSKSTDINPFHLYLDPGVYTVKLTAYNQCVSCGGGTVQGSSSMSLQITVNPMPALDFSIKNNLLCVDNAISFSNDTKEPLSAFQWNFGDPASGPLNFSVYPNPVHVYKAPGTYIVSLGGQTMSAKPCSDTIRKPVVINDKPHALFSDSSVCLSEQAQFINLSTNFQNCYWIFGDGNFSADINPRHQYSGFGDYFVKLIVMNNEGCSDTSRLLIQIYPIPVANFNNVSLNLENGQLFVTFKNLSSDSCQYVWDFGDGSSLSYELNPVHTYNVTAIYNVTLSVTNRYGCTVDIIKPVYPEKPAYYFYVPNAFSPGSGINTTFHPVVTYFSSYHMKIFNRWGDIIFETSDYSNAWDGTYNGKPCPDDTYVYKIDIRDATELAQTHTYNGYVVLLRK